MTQITYMPTAADNDTTIVDGITFHAYEAVNLPPEKADLFEKLSINPWFTTDAPDEARHAGWSNARNADLAVLKELEAKLASK
jgi:hypothetical protein